jgi:hypothetical protein
VQSALEDVQRVLQAAQKVQETAEKGIKIIRPAAITVVCGLTLAAAVVALRRGRHGPPADQYGSASPD